MLPLNRFQNKITGWKYVIFLYFYSVEASKIVEGPIPEREIRKEEINRFDKIWFKLSQKVTNNLGKISTIYLKDKRIISLILFLRYKGYLWYIKIDQNRLEGAESLKIAPYQPEGSLGLQSPRCPLGAWISFSKLLCRMSWLWNEGFGKATATPATQWAFPCRVTLVRWSGVCNKCGYSIPCIKLWFLGWLVL